MIDFHSTNSRHTYATRTADRSWFEAIKTISAIQGKVCADIGCGGGIYSRALIDLGAERVTGIDWSHEILQGAAEANSSPRITYVQGDAADIPADHASFDLILGRALIHHLEDHQAFFREVYRVLKPGGVLIIQDRRHRVDSL